MALTLGLVSLMTLGSIVAYGLMHINELDLNHIHLQEVHFLSFLSTDTVTDGPPEPKIEISRYPEDMERGEDAASVL